MDKFEYTAEMALFEIYGAIQSAKYDFDSMHNLKILAKNAMRRAGLLEVNQNDG